MKQIKLSGLDAFGSTLLIPLTPTYVTVHTVPDGETHAITIRATNIDNSAGIEVFGRFGAGVDLLDHRVVAESMYELMRDVVLVGPAAITLTSSLANRLYISGSAKVCP